MNRLILGSCICCVGLFIACGSANDEQLYGKYARAELRYYAYAPPLIPHKVLNRDCLDCHKEGLVVQGYRAPATPHPQLLTCEQCHVRAPEEIPLFQENSFVGPQETPSLKQIQPSGPPLLPHRVFMRENCAACHNDSSRTEIVQTTHPDRLNCTQCHIEQDQEVALFKENTEVEDAFN